MAIEGIDAVADGIRLDAAIQGSLSAPSVNPKRAITTGTSSRSSELLGASGAAGWRDPRDLQRRVAGA
jgi:hypothetical protein